LNHKKEGLILSFYI